jgi:hypothetical protein
VISSSGDSEDLSIAGNPRPTVQGNKSDPIVNPVQKVGKGFPVVLAREDKARAGGQITRFFPEAIKFEVHQRVPLKNDGILLGSSPHRQRGIGPSNQRNS